MDASPPASPSTAIPAAASRRRRAPSPASAASEPRRQRATSWSRHTPVSNAPDFHVGANIHSDASGRLMCSYSGKKCHQRRMDGYGFCFKHILEDRRAPFKQCEFMITPERVCHNAVLLNQADDRYCNPHKQTLGLIPKTEKRRLGDRVGVAAATTTIAEAPATTAITHWAKPVSPPSSARPPFVSCDVPTTFSFLHRLKDAAGVWPGWCDGDGDDDDEGGDDFSANPLTSFLVPDDWTWGPRPLDPGDAAPLAIRRHRYLVGCVRVHRARLQLATVAAQRLLARHATQFATAAAAIAVELDRGGRDHNARKRLREDRRGALHHRRGEWSLSAMLAAAAAAEATVLAQLQGDEARAAAAAVAEDGGVISKRAASAALRRGLTAILPCSYDGCLQRSLPLAPFCYQHILCDTRQVLFVGCHHVKALTNERCRFPVLRHQRPPLCANHLPLGAKDKTHLRRTGAGGRKRGAGAKNRGAAAAAAAADAVQAPGWLEG